MGDMGDIFNERAKFSKAKRAENRDSSATILTNAGVSFSIKNAGAHLVIHGSPVIDFWPGTGLWIVQGQSQRRRGVYKLLEHIKFLTNRRNHD